jgi:hypothetical protein
MRRDIYFFNPTCELSVANGSVNFMAPANLRKFENELSSLPCLLAQREDIVLTQRVPDRQFTERLEKAGITLPFFQSIESLLSDPVLLSKDKGFLFPWGWSPAAHKRLSSLKSGCSQEFLNSPICDWRDIHRELYSRKSALTIVQRIVDKSNLDFLLQASDIGKVCTDHDQIIALQQKWGNVVVKSPWSSSGRGLQILRPDQYNQTNRQVITGYLRQQGFVVVEPWHNKVLDLSFQFFSFANSRIEFKGLSTFSTDQSGRYIGNYLQELPEDLASDLKDFLNQTIEKVTIELQNALTQSRYSTDYYGWLGVDAIIFRTRDGKLHFHPCIEINCRFTMGAIALSLRTHLFDGSTGEFRIMHGKEGDFAQFSEEKRGKEPLVIERGKIVCGYLSLTPELSESNFGAYISVKEMI